MPSGCASGSRSSPGARSRSRARSTRRATGCGRTSACAPAPPTARGARRFPPTRDSGSAATGVSSFRDGGPEPLLKALIDGGAGIEALSIERPGLHDAFVAIAGEAAAREMGEAPPQEQAA